MICFLLCCNLGWQVQAESRGDLRSDPRFDAINLIVLVVQEDEDHIRDAYVLVRHDTGDVQRYHWFFFSLQIIHPICITAITICFLPAHENERLLVKGPIYGLIQLTLPLLRL